MLNAWINSQVYLSENWKRRDIERMRGRKGGRGEREGGGGRGGREERETSAHIIRYQKLHHRSHNNQSVAGDHSNMPEVEERDKLLKL